MNAFARATLTVARRELTALFAAPIAWVALTGVALATGLFFFDNLRGYNAEIVMLQSQAMFAEVMGGDVPADMNLADRVLYPTAIQVAFAFVAVVPLVTMGVFAEERARRTDEFLFTLGLPRMAIAAGKFLATWAFITALVAITVLLPALGAARAGLDSGPLAALGAGFLLFGYALAAIGLVCSALTRNQLIAALAAYAASSAVFDLSWLFPMVPRTVALALEQLSLATHLGAFPHGVIAAVDVAYFAIVCVTGFLLACIALDLERIG